MADSSQPAELDNSGCKDIVEVCIFAADILLLLFSIWGLQALKDYYIPWYVISRDGDNVFVRPGPDKDYAHVRKLKGNEPVVIVDEVYDWFVLSQDPLEMVRQDTMKAVKCSSSNPCYSQIEFMKTNPPWHLIAINLLWYLPRIRTFFWRGIWQ